MHDEILGGMITAKAVLSLGKNAVGEASAVEITTEAFGTTVLDEDDDLVGMDEDKTDDDTGTETTLDRTLDETEVVVVKGTVVNGTVVVEDGEGTEVADGVKGTDDGDEVAEEAATFPLNLR